MRKIAIFMIKINRQNGSAAEIYDELLHATGKYFGDLCDILCLTAEEKNFIVEQGIPA